MSASAPISVERHHWMDLLRGAAILLVVAWHATVIPDRFGMEMPDVIVTVNTALTPYRIPTLLVLSGMLLPRSLAKPVGTYYAGKARNILWPYLVWTVITALAIDVSLLADPGSWYVGIDHLWFLTTLLVCYSVAPLLRRIPGWLVAFALFGGWLVFLPSLPGVSNWIWSGAYFFLGTSIVRLKIARLPWWIASALAVVAIGGMILAVTGLGTGRLSKAFWIAISLAGIGVLLWAAPRIPRFRATRALESVGRRSIVYYVAHTPVIYVTFTALAALGVTDGWAMYFAIFAVGIAVPFLLTRIPGAHWLFAFGRARAPRNVRAALEEA